MIKNYKHKKACLSLSVSRRGSQETLNQKGFMMVKNKDSKRLPFFKKGVYVKDIMALHLPQIREDRNDRGGLTNTLCSKIYHLFLFVFLLALSGCMGVYEGGFECPAGTGVGCKSISEVNDLVNADELPKAVASLSAQKADIWYSPSFIREHVRYKRVHGKVPF